jgi:site-specific DNA-cytosine methylase
MKHSSIIPLIGGEAIGVEEATGNPPDYLLSYTPFAKNDSHLVNYYASRGLVVPYHDLDTGPPPFSTKVDAVSSVCPCAGLSSLSVTSSGDSEVNDWMYKTTEYVLNEIKPAVYWGENAPALYTDKGTKVRERLKQMGRDRGYTLSMIRTQSLLHGVPQVRNRSFFFLWRGNKVPIFDYYDRPYPTIEELIVQSKGNSQTEPVNHRKPSDDPFYEYILKEIAGGQTHREFMQSLHRSERPSTVRGNDVLSMALATPGHTKERMRDWMIAHGHEKGARIIEHEIHKESIGKGTMRRNTVLPHKYIGAFVGHYPTCLAHPVEDRYISYREAMSIMGLPQSFELLDAKRSVNHICQNVPVPTARDMAHEVMTALGSPGEREWVEGPIMQNNVGKRIDSGNKSGSTLASFFA